MSGDAESQSTDTEPRTRSSSSATEEIVDPTSDGTDSESTAEDDDSESTTQDGDSESTAEDDDSESTTQDDDDSESTTDGSDGDATAEGSSDTEDVETSGAAASTDATGADDGTTGAAGSTSEAPGDESEGDASAGSTADPTARERPTGDVAVTQGETVPVGVKLGSTRTVIALPATERGGLRTVRTLTCAATYDDPLTGEEHALYGEEASMQYPDRVEYMLRSGLPEDEASAELASQFFSSIVGNHDVPENSAVVYAIPTIDNQRGLENLEQVIEESDIGADLVESYPESLCAAIPVFGDDLSAVSDIFIAVNMGSTNLEACAYRRGEQLAPFTTGAVTGNEVDRMIANNVEGETQGRVHIDTQIAREYKEEHADFESFEPFTDRIQQPGGGVHEFTIERSVMNACDEYLDAVVEEFANTFLPELANEHMKVYQYTLEQPIVLTGGMACIPGIVEEFERRLSDELRREVEAVAPHRPDLAATIGAQRIASRLVRNG